jgi:plastocyanin
MRKITVLVAACALVAAIAATTAFAATSVGWKVGTNKTVHIRKGGTVRWVWADGLQHNVHGPGFTSALKSKKGFSFSHRFNKKGTFKIICQVHPTSMKTTVKVS